MVAWIERLLALCLFNRRRERNPGCWPKRRSRISPRPGNKSGQTSLLNPGYEPSEELAREVADAAAGELGKAFKPERVIFVPALPKTRSAKIVRRAVRATAIGQDPGDLSSLENPEALEEIEALARA